MTTRTEPAVGLFAMASAAEWEHTQLLCSPERTLNMTLYRPRDDRMIAGVCSGIARRFNLDPTIVRIAFVASLFLPGPQILIYLAAWLLMPDEATTVA
jgi:phage shock protein PspC (stress-responsive transcriptional regulator)